jgi:hypothetical protein
LPLYIWTRRGVAVAIIGKALKKTQIAISKEKISLIPDLVIEKTPLKKTFQILTINTEKQSRDHPHSEWLD